MAQTQGNKVTEVVDGVVEQVDVSKHPTASIEASDLSLADIERRKSHPGHWALFIALVLVALIAPYWWGRVIAVKDAAWMVANLSFLDPKGVALISWTVTIMAMAGLGLMVADVKKWLWGFKRSCSVTADLSPLLPSCRQNRKISGGSVRADNRTARSESVV